MRCGADWESCSKDYKSRSLSSKQAVYRSLRPELNPSLYRHCYPLYGPIHYSSISLPLGSNIFVLSYLHPLNNLCHNAATNDNQSSLDYEASMTGHKKPSRSSIGVLTPQVCYNTTLQIKHSRTHGVYSYQKPCCFDSLRTFQLDLSPGRLIYSAHCRLCCRLREMRPLSPHLAGFISGAL